MASDWPDKEVQKLRELIAEGLTSGQIHKRMPWRSRSAVVGKAHRLHLTIGTPGSKRAASRRGGQALSAKMRAARAMKSGKSAAAAAKKTPVAPPAPKSAVVFKGPALPPDPVTPVEEIVIPVAERKTLQDLTKTCCRWPIGDPQMADFHFCCRTKVPGFPYCEGHARRAYAPPQIRRSEASVDVRPVAVKDEVLA